MSTPQAKRRRLDTASSVLSKPFRSPFKTPIKTESTTSQASDQASASEQDVPLRHKNSLLAASSTKTPMNKPLHQLGSRVLFTPFTRNSATPGPLSSLSKPLLSAGDPDVAALMKKQRELEKNLREIKEELDTAEQALKIEKKSEKKGDKEVDGELRTLVAKWKAATRGAAEDVFGGVKDKINKAGGPRAWKETQKKVAADQRAWEEEGRKAEREEALKAMGNDEDDESDPDDDEEEKMLKRQRKDMRDAYMDCGEEDTVGCSDYGPRSDYEVESELEKLQRGDGRVSEGNEEDIEDEYTMGEMLKTLNIPINVIGFDLEEQRWID